MAVVRVGMAQLNLRLGDLDGNAAMITNAYDTAVALGAHLVVFSELTVTGYPPEDLLLKPAFIEGAARALERIAAHTGEVPAVVGFPSDTGHTGPVRLRNSAAMCSNGAVRGVYHKHLLPNYAVFDEQRYFVPGTDAGPLLWIASGDAPEVRVRVGVSVCEDLWGPPRTADAPAPQGELPSFAGADGDVSPAGAQVELGAQLLVNLNGSPYRRGKQADREAIARTRALGLGVPVVYVNQVGGQDELVFDGNSFITDASGQVQFRLPAFAEHIAVCEVDVDLEHSASSPSNTRKIDSTKRTGNPGDVGSTRDVGGAGDVGNADSTSTGTPSVSRTPSTPSVSRAPSTSSASSVSRVRSQPDSAVNVLVPLADPLEEVWGALVIATRDYVRKNGFSEVVVGLSGGIDSSAVAAIAADALGGAHVHGVSMPSRYSSDGSRSDAAELAHNLGIDFRTVAIEPAHAALAGMLDSATAAESASATDAAVESVSATAAAVGSVSATAAAADAATAAADLADQNIQSRVRGLLLMALSNRFNWLVLTTGNKTETSVGYTTLYGDTAGGFAVIRDVPKLLVYELCAWRNRQPGGEVIPTACITKPPSAELRPDQRDDQSLPAYELLDPLVEAYVEGDLSAAQAVAAGREHGAAAEVVHRVTRLIDIAEYKRRQSPPGPRITAKSFGKDRRMPITNFYR